MFSHDFYICFHSFEIIGVAVVNQTPPLKNGMILNQWNKDKSNTSNIFQQIQHRAFNRCATVRKVALIQRNCSFYFGYHPFGLQLLGELAHVGSCLPVLILFSDWFKSTTDQMMQTGMCPARSCSKTPSRTSTPPSRIELTNAMLFEVVIFPQRTHCAMGSLAQTSSGAILCSFNTRFRARFRRCGANAEVRFLKVPVLSL